MSLIAHIGKPGSFSHLAARAFYGIDHTYMGCASFDEVFQLVSVGDAEIGVIPVENSLAGSIYENYDLFNKYPLSICGEQYLKVEHFLLSKKGSTTGEDRMKEIKVVYSHPKALEQCKAFFAAHPWMKPTVAADTATAAALVAASDDFSMAAIGSADSAHLYRLAIQARNIEDDKKNYTRFIYVRNTPRAVIPDVIRDPVIANANKCSLQFEVAHKPGSLIRTLQVISDHKLNLTKIESRPIHGKPFEYQFYVDFEFSHEQTAQMHKILEAIRANCDRLQVLGIYRAGVLEM
ncbi:MAG: prephenate dehydratase domain-containing protein [bacterium]